MILKLRAQLASLGLLLDLTRLQAGCRPGCILTWDAGSLPGSRRLSVEFSSCGRKTEATGPQRLPLAIDNSQHARLSLQGQQRKGPRFKGFTTLSQA